MTKRRHIDTITNLDLRFVIDENTGQFFLERTDNGARVAELDSIYDPDGKYFIDANDALVAR